MGITFAPRYPMPVATVTANINFHSNRFTLPPSMRRR
jgi:hypothetical protein